MIPYLNNDGSFYATFWINDEIILKDAHGSRMNEFKFSKQPFEFYEEICNGFCGVEHIGEWNHPSHQQLLRFYND